MNIGVNARMLLPGVKEGVSRYIHETVSRMVRSHPEDTFHFYFDRPYDSEYIFGPNVIPHVIPPPARHPILWRVWFDYMLPRKMKQDGVEVLYSGDGFGCLRTSVPQVLVSHDLAFEHFDHMIYRSHLRYLRKYAKRFHDRATSIIAVSNATKLDIINSYQIPASKILVAGNSTSLVKSVVVDKSVSNGKDYFMYIGSLNPRKNIVRLIQAFDLFKEDTNTQHKLVIVGRLAWKSTKIRLAIEKAKFANDIIHISSKVEDVSLLISNATALIYPSIFEGFGIPILEGFACGTPVITSGIGSMDEVAGDGAVKIDPYSVQDIADAMYQIQYDKLLAESYVHRGYERLKHYSWDDTAEKTYQKISKIVTNG